ncbi:phosphoribosyl-AMP cyclohydrolase [Acidaminococcus intestini]|nr:phosphoribosyl-AMP cyclohydrolase [Acidaminococcus intestini]
MKIDISHLKFDERGLIPAIVQDVTTDKVLMLAYMNGQSLARTVETGYTWFWSRSRQELWNKGATSGNLQKVKSIVYDCDGDTLLVRVVQKGLPAMRATTPASAIRCGTRALVRTCLSRTATFPQLWMNSTVNSPMK